jgi:hypothetical protein
MRFLAVEVPNADSPVTRLSRSLPDAVLDVFVKVPQAGEDPVARAVCQARGGSAADREALMAATRQVDPDAVSLPSPPGILLVQARFPLVRATPEMQAMASFAAAQGIWAVWCLVSDGVMFLRLLADGRPDTLAQDLQAHLDARGIDAQAALEETSDAQTRENVRALTVLLEQFRHGPAGPSEGF